MNFFGFETYKIFHPKLCLHISSPLPLISFFDVQVSLLPVSWYCSCSSRWFILNLLYCLFYILYPVEYLGSRLEVEFLFFVKKLETCQVGKIGIVTKIESVVT